MNFAVFILYSLTQFFGLFIAQKFLESGDSSEILKKTSPENPIGFLIYFLAAVIFVLFILYFRKKPFTLLKPLIALAIWAGISIPLQLIIQSALISYLAAIFITWLFFKLKEIWFHNLIIIFAIAGIAGLAGLNFSPLGMIIILAALAAYDYWMVVSSRHMIHIAKEFLKEHIFLGVIAPKSCEGYLHNLKKSDFNHNNFTLLGGGDLAFPLMFASSIFKNQGLNDALVIVLFGIIGLFSIGFLTKKHKVIPALIPLAIFLVAGYLFTILF